MISNRTTTATATDSVSSSNILNDNNKLIVLASGGISNAMDSFSSIDDEVTMNAQDDGCVEWNTDKFSVYSCYVHCFKQ